MALSLAGTKKDEREEPGREPLPVTNEQRTTPESEPDPRSPRARLLRPMSSREAVVWEADRQKSKRQQRGKSRRELRDTEHIFLKRGLTAGVDLNKRWLLLQLSLIRVAAVTQPYRVGPACSGVLVGGCLPLRREEGEWEKQVVNVKENCLLKGN